MPMYKTLAIAVKITQKLTIPIWQKYQLKKSQKMTRKKIAEVEKLINARDLF